MANARYRAGGDLERAAKAYLEVNGYIVVKSGGSKGCADLVALKPGPTVLLVQCKTAGYLSPAERTELVGVAALTGSTPLAARWVKDGRSARQVWFTELTGDRVQDQRAWTPDYGMEIA